VESVEVLENGPVRAAVRVVKTTMSPRLRHSRYQQDITLTLGGRRLDLRTRVDWQEENCLLKAVFPLGLIAESATYEMPYGTISRPTGLTTPWERARWEVPGQKWADLSYGGYGVSILNDGKYGLDIHNAGLRLTLLRGGTRLEPTAERGVHTFTYSLYPHVQDWRNGTIREANELNYPLICLPASSHSGPLPSSHSFVSVEPENVVLEAMKQAEDSDALILRLVEYFGQETTASVTLPQPPRRAWLVNLLETELEALAPQDPLRVPIGPHRIVTVKVEF